MDALLIALLGCLAGEMGDKGQRLALALSTRFDRNGAVIAGLAVAAMANAAIGAAAGSLLASMLGSDARLLFLALALLFLGAGMCWPVRTPDPLTDWRLGPFLTSALGLFILGFGEGAQFLILGLTVRTADPLLAASGGAIGIIAASLPVILLRERMFQLPLRGLRYAGGALILLAALLTGVSALHLA
ncbi:TMEM165/GDT1 family protein [Sphingobium bisphenolivorans]|uniref:TMEM165/GDT1 family protein n=1 Tax=Sphingobium bisphenolivorans TaxID=1335760 RepID=UPI0003A8FF64|nr:TMEM165/GDT1 family protein [Sphingobium bisphenolivorans]